MKKNVHLKVSKELNNKIVELSQMAFNDYDTNLSKNMIGIIAITN